MSKSFVPYGADHDFPIENLPFGVFKRQDTRRNHIGVAIGDFVLDLTELEAQSHLKFAAQPLFQAENLNEYASLSNSTQSKVRQILLASLADTGSSLRDKTQARDNCLLAGEQVVMQLPFTTSGFTDFYASEHHARWVGMLYRDKNNAVLPNWHSMPIAYNGRSSTLRVSGQQVTRPRGLVVSGNGEAPQYQASSKLDYELEMGAFVGRGTDLGQSLNCDSAGGRIFGFVLLNLST